MLSVKLKNVQFEGQTKTKLGNSEVRPIVEAAVVEGMRTLAAQNGSKKVFEEIIKKAQGAARVRLAARQAKDTARAKNSIDSLMLGGKLGARPRRRRRSPAAGAGALTSLARGG